MTPSTWKTEELGPALETFASAPEILLGLDFDGTLAPLVDDPLHSRMIDSARDALVALTEAPGTTIALITGRAIDSIRVVGEPLPTWWLVGSHGVEVVSPSERDFYSSPDVVPEHLSRGFQDVVGRHPGARYEKKPFGVAIHTRGMPTDLAHAAEDEAHRFLESYKGEGTVRLGHGIVEFAMRSGNKGEGIQAIRARLGAHPVLFAGDDRTDEDGFAVLEHHDIGIRVGGGETKARHRVADPHEVAEVLWQVHALRS